MEQTLSGTCPRHVSGTIELNGASTVWDMSQAHMETRPNLTLNYQNHQSLHQALSQFHPRVLIPIKGLCLLENSSSSDPSKALAIPHLRNDLSIISGWIRSHAVETQEITSCCVGALRFPQGVLSLVSVH